MEIVFSYSHQNVPKFEIINVLMFGSECVWRKAVILKKGFFLNNFNIYFGGAIGKGVSS